MRVGYVIDSKPADSWRAWVAQRHDHLLQSTACHAVQHGIMHTTIVHVRSAMLLKAQSLYSECSLACIAAYLLVVLRQHNQPGQPFFPCMDCNAMCTLCTQLAGYKQAENHL